MRGQLLLQPQITHHINKEEAWLTGDGGENVILMWSQSRHMSAVGINIILTFQYNTNLDYMDLDCNNNLH